MDKNNIKDNLNNSVTDKDTERLYGHVMDKIQRLTGALYRVTDLYLDKEPIKWTLRDNALNLYTSLMSVIRPGRMSVRTSSDIDEILNSISQIVCTLELASLGGFVSDINFDVLKKEYVLLKAFLEGKKGDFVSSQKLIESEIVSIAGDETFAVPANGASPEENRPGRKSAPSSAPANRKSPFAGSGERKAKIVDFLRGNGKKTVKDIAVMFQGVSEKTVQRYLLNMVEAGELAAEGQKRWRRYRLTERRG